MTNRFSPGEAESVRAINREVFRESVLSTTRQLATKLLQVSRVAALDGDYEHSVRGAKVVGRRRLRSLEPRYILRSIYVLTRAGRSHA
jgi:hypothetical protein